jgi:hypothetical protein
MNAEKVSPDDLQKRISVFQRNDRHDVRRVVKATSYVSKGEIRYLEDVWNAETSARYLPE